jgi:hypothetical protein
MRMTSPSLDRITTTVIVCLWVTVTPFLRGWISLMRSQLVSEILGKPKPALPDWGHLKKGKFMYAKAQRRGFSGFAEV